MSEQEIEEQRLLVEKQLEEGRRGHNGGRTDEERAVAKYGHGVVAQRRIDLSWPLHEVVDAARQELIAANDPPKLFRHGGLVRIGRDDEGRPVIARHSRDSFRVRLARVADWVRPNKEEGFTTARPEAGAVGAILDEPDELAVPVVERIVTAPVLGRDGAVLTAPGYHPSARVFFEPLAGEALPRVPSGVTDEELKAARVLLIELVNDFPFASGSDYAHALGLLLLPFVRSLIDGPTPLHMIEAPDPGSGKSLLATVLCYPALGYAVPGRAEGSDEDEWRKRITAALAEGREVVMLDNLTRRLDSGALSKALTSTSIADRILGHTKDAEIPVRCTWIATGNNPAVSKELSRRTVRIRLVAEHARPWERSGFTHPNLLAWTAANRTRLVEAALTLAVAWRERGMPEGSRSLGSYERWAAVIGGILEVAGGQQFLAEWNMDEFYDAADDERAAVADLFAAASQRFGEQEVQVKHLLSLAMTCEGLDLGSRNQADMLGKLLARLKDTVVDTEAGRFQLVRVPHRRRSTYRLRRLV